MYWSKCMCACEHSKLRASIIIVSVNSQLIKKQEVIVLIVLHNDHDDHQHRTLK